MNSDPGPDGSDGVPGDEDVPIYEPLYPDYEHNCSHPDCTNDAPAEQRICDDCDAIMHVHTSDMCSHCGERL